jgi:hypothetical protein
VSSRTARAIQRNPVSKNQTNQPTNQPSNQPTNQPTKQTNKKSKKRIKKEKKKKKQNQEFKARFGFLPNQKLYGTLITLPTYKMVVTQNSISRASSALL